MAPKFKMLAFMLMSTMLFSACNGSTEEPVEVVEEPAEVVTDDFGYDLGESMDELLFETYSGNYVVPCVEGWVCNKNYGGTLTITNAETYDTVNFYDVYGSDVETLIGANEELLLMGDREVVERLDWQDTGMASVIKDNQNGNMYWLSIADIGFDGALLKCQGNFTEASYEANLAEVQQICASATLQ
jgi:hypothetical protein